ncbi:hypothetical protein BO83DRAFT_164562 [Aspergillus eucalypticola CBS 122712]|uniref:Zn(2)-C6 fungal-type domain-containing protein n=1 Tax=Aspergillus eucalypticola (strain CBS 122712 / IBT 29274) TaxID=1448314 RepID=A0A317UMA4_ASPEC|nr:uncharacterized protein BO83DRAFT_164562 [Aspergillus eucalypticola CBS 122712]PWY63044.1 hypothetical protein BO83DRAFT_164562 [Aspergillus eucalypticola CBS 122712]
MDHRPPRPKTRPKVAEKDRKRARKACTLCQIRKAKCVKATSGACVNCARQSLPCSLQYTTNFDASTTSRENESIQCSQSSTSANGDDQNSSSRSSIVPRIFNSIRLPEQPDQPDLILEDLSSKRLLEKIADSMFLSDASTASSITSSGVSKLLEGRFHYLLVS